MVLSEAEAFLLIASADLATAKECTDPTRFREAAWGFWLQQAVEKGLKAWLLHLDVLPPRSHDLARLMLLLHRAGADLDRFEFLDQLTDFAVQFRYEADADPMGLDREAWNGEVGVFLDLVRRVLGR